MRLRHFALAPVLVLVVAACSGTGSTPSPSVAAGTSSPLPSAAAQRIEVQLTDSFRIEPAEMSVRSGQQVTFVVTNTGAIEHEFYLGDEAAQAEQELMMASGQMAHETAGSISLQPGETKELTYTFTTGGPTLAGCHIAGHYAAGMKAAISITD